MEIWDKVSPTVEIWDKVSRQKKVIGIYEAHTKVPKTCVAGMGVLFVKHTRMLGHLLKFQ